MDKQRIRILGSDDQYVLWISLVVFIAISSVYFWQRSIVNNGLVDFDEIQHRDAAFVVDVNHAAWQEFANLPGIGEKLAKEIVAFRNENGQFANVDQLVDVRGVGQKKLQAIRPYLAWNPIANGTVGSH